MLQSRLLVSFYQVRFASSDSFLSRLPLVSKIKKVKDEKSKPVISVINLHGPILHQQKPWSKKFISMENSRKNIDKAFDAKKLEAVFLSINSPGGMAVQSDMVCKYIQQKAKKKGIKVLSFVEDQALSGGYWLACTAERIYAARSSVVGSIGAIYMGLGYHELLNRYGVEGRTYTAGENKAILNPMAPIKEKDVKIITNMLTNVHKDFIDHVRKNRGDRLKGSDGVLFSGEFWTGEPALDLGLIDGIETMDEYIERVYGDEVRVSRVLGMAGYLSSLGVVSADDMARTWWMEHIRGGGLPGEGGGGNLAQHQGLAELRERRLD